MALVTKMTVWTATPAQHGKGDADVVINLDFGTALCRSGNRVSVHGTPKGEAMTLPRPY